jgi:tRNA A-37 threonylcarbamoyl transferase component Bud32
MNTDQHCSRVRIGTLHWWVSDAESNDVEALCADIEGALSKASMFYKNSRNITAAVVVSAAGRRLVVRRMNYGKLRHRLKDLFRPSRARRSFFCGLRLEAAGLRTPGMLAVAEARRLRWPLAAYLISDEVPNARTLSRWAHEGGREARRVAERLAAAIARMHDLGFIHRDLKPSNVLLDGDLNPWLIDMDGVRFVRKVSLREVVRDLRVLARVLTKNPQLRCAALRFLVCYCRTRGLMTKRRKIASLVTAMPGLR